MPAAVVKLSKDRRPPDDHLGHGWVGLPGRPRPDSSEALLAMMTSAIALLEETARLQRETLNSLQSLAAHSRPNATVEAPAFCQDGLPVQLPRRKAPPRRAQGPDRAMVPAEPLTAREETVLRLLHSSLSLPQISRELYVSHNTIKTHTRAIYRKLGVSNRHEAIQRHRELAAP